jgi:hypothetical protein
MKNEQAFAENAKSQKSIKPDEQALYRIYMSRHYTVNYCIFLYLISPNSFFW